MKLSEFIKKLDVVSVNGSSDPDIDNVCSNTESVKEGSIFVAVKGTKFDGHDFVKDAVKKGAVAVVVEKSVGTEKATEILVKNSKKALALLSSRFYNDPSESLGMIGVTGTNGKTTFTYLMESVLKSAGRKPGVIGTVNYRFGGKEFAAPNTTPMPIELQKTLAQMRDSKISDVVMEVSSHALDQNRVAGCSFDIGVFTNLTQDHLDYHLSIEKYFEAKASFFSIVLSESSKYSKKAIINCDDGFGKKIAEKYIGKNVSLIRYGISEAFDVTAEKYESTIRGTRIDVKTPWGSFECLSNLKGRFNVMNILSVVAAAGAYEIPIKTIKEGIENLKFVPGRLEDVPNKKGISVFVDYAHTPDALKNVIDTLNAIKKGRLITVFGCGGDRDKLKRPMMGKIAAEGSDVVIITSDNPRTESPEKIISEILPGVSVSRNDYTVEADRKNAIEKAVKMASKDDVVLIAGKGHEDYQIIGTVKHHFDDREIAREFLN